eukprot:scaffold211072_cov20-Prasinocladus_malaysianus.AAC.1
MRATYRCISYDYSYSYCSGRIAKRAGAGNAIATIRTQKAQMEAHALYSYTICSWRPAARMLSTQSCPVMPSTSSRTALTRIGAASLVRSASSWKEVHGIYLALSRRLGRPGHPMPSPVDSVSSASTEQFGRKLVCWTT